MPIIASGTTSVRAYQPTPSAPAPRVSGQLCGTTTLSAPAGLAFSQAGSAGASFASQKLHPVSRSSCSAVAGTGASIRTAEANPALPCQIRRNPALIHPDIMRAVVLP
ncbi:hypothetical protein QP162_17820 [Sphingomonas aurantiaca]